MLRDHAKITAHSAAGRCGARTRACRVGTYADAFCRRPQKRRDESRRGTHECVRHDPGCEVIFAPALSVIILDAANISDDELQRQFYGDSTADAVLVYKRKRSIINRAYQTTADNIVGKTVADKDIARCNVKQVYDTLTATGFA